MNNNSIYSLSESPIMLASFFDSLTVLSEAFSSEVSISFSLASSSCCFLLIRLSSSVFNIILFYQQYHILTSYKANEKIVLCEFSSNHYRKDWTISEMVPIKRILEAILYFNNKNF